MFLAFDEFLSRISRCFIPFDLALWRGRLILPFSIVTKDGLFDLQDDDAVAENSAHYLEAWDPLSLVLTDHRHVEQR